MGIPTSDPTPPASAMAQRVQTYRRAAYPTETWDDRYTKYTQGTDVFSKGFGSDFLVTIEGDVRLLSCGSVTDFVLCMDHYG